MSTSPPGSSKKPADALGETVADFGKGGSHPTKATASGATIRPGAVFAKRYEILEQIGRGGMGEVFRALDRHVGDTIALKRLRFDPGDTRSVERFRREVRLARRVSHPNVARIYDLGQDGDLIFLSMEFIDGCDLEHVRRTQGRLPVADMVRIGLDCARGLEAAHAAGVIHQDLKPANIMRDASGRIVITDFGIAAGLDDAQVDQGTAEVLGSPAYMAPERVESGDPDRRSDIYSLGIILYELLSGELPFEGKTPLAMATARLQVPPKALSSDLNIPAELAQLVMACLERNPEHRPASAEELRLALQPFAPKDDTAPSAPKQPTLATESLFAPILRSGPTLRVRPFQYRGPADSSYLGDGISEELVDTLSRTRGLRVIASVREEQSSGGGPRQAVNVLVDGTVQRQGNRFRIIARLTKADSKAQLWSESFQGEFEDLFEAQELIARRVAEALRLEIHLAAQHDRIAPEAVQLYLKARKQVSVRQLLGDDGAIALLEQCLELAPDFKPAIGWRSLALARSFWDERALTHLTVEEIESCVQQALERAPNQAESHFAAAVLSSQLGNYVATARHLADCLEVAPTCSDANAYLGELQCATGRITEGRERLRLAIDLEEDLQELSVYPLIRLMAFDGNWTAVERTLQNVLEAQRVDGAVMSMFLRAGMWADRQDWIEQVGAWTDVSNRYAAAYFGHSLGYILGDKDPTAFDREMRAAIESSQSLRFRSLILQILAELHCYAGHHELALLAVEDSVAATLNDVDWMLRCPVLECIRSDARFTRLTELLQKRALAIWNA